MTRVVKKINSAGFCGIVAHTPQDYYTQTPGNYSINNYYIRELQDKVDAEWEYRPNRITVEYETETNANKWLPIEVVAQSIKNEKGKDVSEDYLNLVFRDIQETRFEVGHKFKFSRIHDINSKEKDKNVWLVTNRNLASMTSSVVVQRCNGTLGSQWIDEQGVAHNHYEPAILSGELNSVNLFYNSVADSPQAHLVVIVQYNDITSHYQMNQRFILGAQYFDASGKSVAQVYRIKTIDSFYGLTTHNPNDVGLIRLYMEITELSEYDNFDTRIAYQENAKVVMVHTDDDPESGVESPMIVFSEPKFIPTDLGSTTITFVPVLKNGAGEIITGDWSEHIRTVCTLENCPVQYDSLGNQIDIQGRYIEFVEHTVQEGYDCYSFELRRNRIYLNGDLAITCMLPAQYSPTREEIATSFKLVVSKQEV